MTREPGTGFAFLRNIGLMMTYRCQAACPHCVVGAGPHRKEEVSLEEAIGWISQMAAYRDGHIAALSLTGGEPFCCFEKLKEATRYAAQLGMVVTTVTNGFWATTVSEAVSVLARLEGLKMIGISADPHHQAFIPFDRVRNAVAAARAEVIVHRRIKVIVRQFLDRGIVAPEDQPQFESLIASAMRVRNSVLAEVLLLAFAIVGGYWLGQRYIAMQVATWYAVPIGDQTQFTAAGYWYLFVSLTIFRFLLVRWYFRLFVWYRFLWQVSRHIRLRLNALHPDRAGGLAFLSGSVFAFAPVLLAHTIGLAGILGGKIWHEGATLPQFKVEIAAWMVFLMLLVLAPLFFFVTQLADAKRTGLREYGIVASRYVADFRRKWIEGHSAKDESLVGTADIQSLADLSNSFEVVREMRLVPFGRATVLRLALLTALPLCPADADDDPARSS